MTRTIAMMLTALSLAACKGAAPAPQAEVTRAATPAVGTVATATVSTGGASAVEESTDLYEFDYSYPAEAGRIAELRAWLDGERSKAKAGLIADAEEGKAAAKDGGFEYHAYAAGRKWLRVADTPRFLSLSAELYDYSGGAHPNHGFDALVWDKQAKARLVPQAMFVSAAALDGAIQPRFCDLLDKERAKRRGEPVRRGSDDAFSDCIKPSEQTVILGSSNGQTFDKLGVLIGPYAAGSYAEGDYEFTLPVTPRVLAAVKPEYRSAFTTR